MVADYSDQAGEVLDKADQIFTDLGGTTAYQTQVGHARIAMYAHQGAWDQVLIASNPLLTLAEHHQNAALLADLWMMRAIALDRQDQIAAARAARLDSLGWARYAYGDGPLLTAWYDGMAHLAE